MHPLDPIAASAGGSVIYPDDNEHYSMAQWWDLVGGAAHAVRQMARGQQCVAVVQDNSARAQLGVLGGWAAGVTMASVPLMVGGTERWCQQINALASQCGFDVVMVADPHAVSSGLAHFGIQAEPYPALSLGPAPSVSWASEFIQCTSGSTGTPKGVRLDLQALAAHLDALAERLHTEGPWRSVGWLPTSHDMGFVGLFVLAIRQAAITGGCVVLGRPERYLKDPSWWPQELANYGATVTAAPDTSWRLLARQLAASAPGQFGDLSSLRHGVNGGEVVRWSGIQDLLAAGAPHGMCPSAVRPGYGMAEVGLAVALTVGEPTAWVTTRDKLSAPGASLVPWTGQSGSDVVTLTSCGPPLAGIGVTTPTPGVPGPLIITSDQLFIGYAGTSQRGGVQWQTPDVGVVTPTGDVVVIGRSDDVITVAGKKLHPEDIEGLVADHPSVVSGRVAAVSSSDGGWWLVVSLRTGSSASVVSRDIRRMLADYAIAPPRGINVVAKDAFFRTTSGKPRRSAMRNMLSNDQDNTHDL